MPINTSVGAGNPPLFSCLRVSQRLFRLVEGLIPVPIFPPAVLTPFVVFVIERELRSISDNLYLYGFPPVIGAEKRLQRPFLSFGNLAPCNYLQE